MGVPYNNQVLAGPIKHIKLPESTGDSSINPKLKYNSGIQKGNNQMTLIEKDIYNNKFSNHTFQWTWQETKKDWQHSHQVHIKLKIVRLLKKK